MSSIKRLDSQSGVKHKTTDLILELSPGVIEQKQDLLVDISTDPPSVSSVRETRELRFVLWVHILAPGVTRVGLLCGVLLGVFGSVYMSV